MLNYYFVRKGDYMIQNVYENKYKTATYDNIASNNKLIIKALQCDSNNIFTINGKRVIESVESVESGEPFDICMGYRDPSAPDITLKQDDWLIYTIYDKSPSIYKFDKNKFGNNLNLKFNIPYFVKILEENNNSIIPKFRLDIHLGENKNTISTTSEIENPG